MRAFIFTLSAVLTITIISGCGEPERAPSLSQNSGNTNNNSSQRPSRPPIKNNTDPNPLDTPEPADPSETEFRPESSDPSQVSKMDKPNPAVLAGVERDAIELLKSRGAIIREADGHAYSLSLKRDNKFNDTDCFDVAKLTKLQFIGLSGSKITDAGLGRISSLKHVSAMLLNKTRVSDKGVIDLQNMTRLSFLDVSGTNISEEGQGLLKDTFPDLLIAASGMAAMDGNPDEAMQPGVDPSGLPAIDLDKLKKFTAGSPAAAVQKVAVALGTGKLEGLSKYISKDADDFLKLVRANKLDQNQINSYRTAFSQVSERSRPRSQRGRWAIILSNGNNQSLHFTCRKESKGWRVYRLVISSLDNPF